MPGVYVLQSPVDTGDNSLPVAVRDPLITGAIGGVKFLFDLAFPWCYPGGAYAGRPAAGAPASGAVVYDMSEAGNGSFVGQAGDVTGYAGGGFDFAATTKVGNCVQGSGAAATSIWGSANQYFLVCAYLKLPTQANWSSAASIFDLLKFAAGAAGTYQNGPELCTIAQANPSGGALTFRRQNGAGTADNIGSIIPAAGEYGNFAQLALWRDATGQYGRLKTANGTQLVSAAVGVNNTQNFSGLPVKVGAPGGFSGAAGTAFIAGQTNAAKFRLYRAFIENLFLSGRDPATVLDADYARVVARIAASAAANGGTSLIFV